VSRFTALVIDDEPSVLAALGRLLRANDIAVISAEHGEQGLATLEANAGSIDVVICDYDMPGMDGAEFLHHAKLRWPAIPRVLLTGKADLPAIARGVNDGEIARLLFKPWNPALLCNELAQVVEMAPRHVSVGESPQQVLEHELRVAVTNDELRLFYQPQVDFATGQVVAVEALVRWQHPHRGLLLPDAFIPIAEQTGTIRQLSRWVLESAMRDTAAWLRAGIELPVWVNLSTWDLENEQLPQVVGELLARTGAAPSSVRVELTEGALTIEPERAIKVLGDLRRLGLQIAIDDFGTGYSSLARLADLPVDLLKLDKMFIHALSTSPGGATLVRSMIDLGHSLGLHIVAEGVEDSATWERLQQMSCDLAQGYLVSRPMPAANVLGWLAEWRLARVSPAEHNPVLALPEHVDVGEASGPQPR
jgi:EAL domain-containing protein (putative c-di-GMP-specific phosphodiesterase class I)/FixJ family two-component response regulator